MKKILLAICGMTPQIITETLFALWERGQFPDVIRIITTRIGRELCITQLLNSHNGKFYTFCKEYDIDCHKVDFSYHSIITAWNNENHELEDIANEEDNALFLRLCMQQAFQYTLEPDNIVYFSIAAGRKTMGASLALAAQCYGRSHDRIYHVLVNSEFESSVNFYYPPRKHKTILLKNKDGEIYYKSTSYAQVSLVNMPFAGVRERLSLDMLRKLEEPETLLASLSHESTSKLIINLPNRNIKYCGREIDIPPAWLSLYTFFAMQKKNALCEKETCDLCFLCYIERIDLNDKNKDVAHIYQQICVYTENQNISNSGILALNSENFQSYKAKINTLIKQSFGPNSFKQIGISSFGKKPDTKYGIALPPNSIQIIL